MLPNLDQVFTITFNDWRHMNMDTHTWNIWATENGRKKKKLLSAPSVPHEKYLKCVLRPLSAFTYLSALFDLLTVSMPRTELITSRTTSLSALFNPIFLELQPKAAEWTQTQKSMLSHLKHIGAKKQKHEAVFLLVLCNPDVPFSRNYFRNDCGARIQIPSLVNRFIHEGVFYVCIFVA